MGGVSFEDEWEVTSSLSNEDQARTVEARTVVLLGKTGNGKSSTGNSIIGEKVFESKFSSAGVTTTCEMHTTTLTDTNHVISVIDTPGLFDYSGDVEDIGKELMKCIDMAKDGIHAVLLVLSVRTRFSREEEVVIGCLRKFFGNNISNYMIVVFTSGDALKDETLDDYLRGCPNPLKETLNMCGNRCLLFNNKTKNATKKSAQLKELLALVDDVVSNNGGKPYTNELFDEMKKQNQICLTGYGALVTFVGSSTKDRSEFEEQLKITQMVDSKLRITTRWLEEELCKERVARLKAEADAEEARKKYEKAGAGAEEARKKSEKAEAGAEEARKKSEEGILGLLYRLQRVAGNCAIL